MRVARLLCLILVGALLAGASRSALALELQLPPGCPSAAGVEADVSALMSSRATLQMRLRVDTAPDGQLRARFALHEHDAERVLYGRDCAALLQAALLVIGLSSEPPTTGLEKRPEEPAYAPPRDKLPEQKKVPERATKAPVYVAGHARAGSDWGSLPLFAFGATGELAIEWRRLRSGLRAGYWFAQDLELSGQATGRARFDLVTGALAACVALLGRGTRRPGAAEIALCGVLELGVLRADARGIATPARAASLWSAAVLEVALAFGPWAHISPEALIGACIPFERASFDIDGLGPVHRPRAFALRLAVGFAVR